MEHKVRFNRLKKIVAIFAVSVWLIGFVVACDGNKQENSENKIKMQHHSSENYDVAFPGDWKEYQYGQLVKGADFEVADTPKDSKTPNASLDVIVTSGAQDLERSVGDFIAFSKTAPSFHLISKNRTTMTDESDAYIVKQKYTTNSAIGKIDMKQIDLLAITTKENEINVRLACQIKFCDKYKYAIKEIMKTVKIK